ncbi:hypothetical protein V6U90_23620 [Micromonospora sp. CPCC 206060]|uniref:hypothetical protein n=1 Tax=Micromonospora sp. CPCC 206060 TaxID=3122406 RepID=UPI002FF2ACE8
MTRPWLVMLAAGGAVVLVVLAVGVLAVRRSGPAEAPAPAVHSTADPGTTSSRLPVPDESYWTPERMRSAQPAPMPTDD